MPGFDPSPEAEAFRARIETFVREQVVPLEARAFLSFDDAMRIEVQALGKAEGLWAPHLSKQLGGGAFEFVEAAALFEEAGVSLLGPLALGIAAPDESPTACAGSAPRGERT
ncbi:MAG: acyl-CoA dehydrogenase [Frankiales bacterium]|nr:acyl-CoA dehydrogenase [Frankiales bacterium]